MKDELALASHPSSFILHPCFILVRCRESVRCVKRTVCYGCGAFHAPYNELRIALDRCP